MFLRLFLYRLKSIFLQKDLTFWTLAFPLILGTFFYLGFGRLLNGTELELNTIPAAVVTVHENTAFETVLKEVEKSDGKALFDLTFTDEDTAIAMLKENKATGIFYVDATPHLTVAENGMEQTLMQSFLSQYCTQSSVFKKIAAEHPEKLADSIDFLSKRHSYGSEISLADASYDPYMQYFYALIAMCCLMSVSSGVECIGTALANLSSLGMRRECAPTRKSVMILSDLAAAFVLQTVGVFIGIAFKCSMHIKMGIALVFMMVNSFFAGLMAATMKDWIEHICPLFNRINPAALISDSLYALNMYPSLTRFARNMGILAVMTLVLCFISGLILRRSDYASL
jgi:ABC-2 type transport system permease protein